MLFSKIPSSFFARARTPFARAGGGGRKTMSTTVKADKEVSEKGAALLAAMGTTFVTYMCADYLSNFIQHPTQMMDYGYFNRLLGRPVDQEFWGTRTQHIVGVAACLTVTDHASQQYFARQLGRPLCFAKSPATFVAHTFLFIFSGVALYCLGDAAMSPLHDDRVKEAKNGLYSTYIGSSTAWYEPYVPLAVARVAGPAAANSWVGGALLPATLAYTTVKGVGWFDWGNYGLNDLEMKMNGLDKRE